MAQQSDSGSGILWVIGLAIAGYVAYQAGWLNNLLGTPAPGSTGTGAPGGTQPPGNYLPNPPPVVDHYVPPTLNINSIPPPAPPESGTIEEQNLYPADWPNRVDIHPMPPIFDYPTWEGDAWAHGIGEPERKLWRYIDQPNVLHEDTEPFRIFGSIADATGAKGPVWVEIRQH